MIHEFTMTRRVQFAETDMAGVLYHANYYRFMEEAETAFWHSVGFSVVTEVEGRPVYWPRVATSCEHFAPARFDDQLEVALGVEAVGNKSVKYKVEFRMQHRVVAVGRMTVVCCATIDGTFEPISIPPGFRAQLETLLCTS